jgi:hypothetical protein
MVRFGDGVVIHVASEPLCDQGPVALRPGTRDQSCLLQKGSLTLIRGESQQFLANAEYKAAMVTPATEPSDPLLLFDISS